VTDSHWLLSHRADPRALPIADRHYNRQRPGTPQFVPPGRCLVLLTADAGALWVTSWPFAEFVRHAWKGAWVNSCFRRESGPLASELIREALAVTAWHWPETPHITCPFCQRTVSMVTFIDRDKVRHKRDFGRCYIRAGFVRCHDTEGGLATVHISPDALPEPKAPYSYQAELWQPGFKLT
jgi:hypothetical protein